MTRNLLILASAATTFVIGWIEPLILVGVALVIVAIAWLPGTRSNDEARDDGRARFPEADPISLHDGAQ